MKFEDIFATEEVVLEETKVYDQPDATDLDKETRHVHRIVYEPEAFASVFKDIIEDDVKHKTIAAKIKAIKATDPFWNRHLDRVTRRKET